MNMVETFNGFFSEGQFETQGIFLFQFSENIYIGIENNDVLLVSTVAEPTRNPIMQKTRKIVLQCTVPVNFTCNGERHRAIVHVIRCLDAQDKEKDVFLRLCNAIFGEERGAIKEADIIEVFNILTTFFTKQKQLNISELQGLYTELFTIWYLRDKLPLHLYWQSQEKMKFDFSFTDKLKLEVKSTQLQERRHRFRHEQLTTEINDIIVLSYLLQKDDTGKSLYTLIVECLDLFRDIPDKVVYLEKVVYDTPQEHLNEVKFHQEHLIHNMKFFSANDIPKFNEETPDGVSNVEYDCILNNISSLDINVVITKIGEALKSEVFSDV